MTKVFNSITKFVQTLDINSIQGKALQDIYYDYETFCIQSQLGEPYGKILLNREIMKVFPNLIKKHGRVNGIAKRRFFIA